VHYDKPLVLLALKDCLPVGSVFEFLQVAAFMVRFLKTSAAKLAVEVYA